MKFITTHFARVLFGLIFGVFGIMHLVYGPGMAGLVPTWLPGGSFWVYLTGVALIAACISIMIKKMIHLAALLLALLMLIFVLTIHLPAVMGGNQMAMSSLLKDIGLMAAALLVAGFYPCTRKGKEE